MKTFFFGACLVFSTSVSLAQTLTPKIGLSLSTVTDNDVKEGSSRPSILPGLTLGLGVSSNITDKLEVCSELLLAQKGFRVSHTGNSFNWSRSEDLKLRLNYLKVPVTLKHYPFPKKTAYLMGGFYAAYAIGGKHDYEFLENDHGVETKISRKGSLDFESSITGYNGDDYSIYKREDFGITFGIGFLINKILVDVRYDLGLTMLSDSSSEPRNRVAQLTLGIPIKKR